MFSRKQLIKLLAPLIVEQIMAVLVGMVDVVMVAAVGEAAVSGVSLVDSISVLIIQIMGALATGGAVISAQYLGKEQPRDARKAAGQLVSVTLALSMVISLIAIIGNRHLLGAIFGKVELSVMDNAQTYFLITALSYPFIGLYNACAALFRSMGNSKVSMMTSLVMNLINVAGNAICVFGLKMGVAGVAYPTLLSRIIAAAMRFVLIQDRRNSIRLSSMKSLVPDMGMIKNILSIGIPGGLESGMFQFGKIFLQSLVSSLGTASIAGYAVASNLVTILYLPGTAIGLGLITIVGQCVGGRKALRGKALCQVPDRGELCHTAGAQLVHGTVFRGTGGDLPAVRTGPKAVPGADYGPQYRHACMALGIYHSPHPEGFPGCQVHHGCVRIFHVDLPHRVRIPVCVHM